ncbi:hypothetical protein [Sulfitobacter alexandrii]|nr:hypothetical protein [Sulfitobacter alexandrii]
MKHWITRVTEDAATSRKDDQGVVRLGTGKCMEKGCGCPSFVDPPGGFNCARCGHAKSEHW